MTVIQAGDKKVIAASQMRLRFFSNRNLPPLGKSKHKLQTAFRSIGNSDCSAVELNGMFYNGKAQTGAANLSRAAFVYTVEALKKAWKLLGIYSAAIIFKGYGAGIGIVSQ